MNMTPILRSLDDADFQKIIKSCTRHSEVRPYWWARLDPMFEFHIVLPRDDGTTPATENLNEWMNEEKRFP